MRSSTLGQFGFNLFWFPWRASQCVSHGASPCVFHEPANPLREILLLLAQFRIVRIGLELLIHLPQHSFQLRPRSFSRRRRAISAAKSALPPGAQPRRGNPQLLSNLAQRPGSSPAAPPPPASSVYWRRNVPIKHLPAPKGAIRGVHHFEVRIAGGSHRSRPDHIRSRPSGSVIAIPPRTGAAG